MKCYNGLFEGHKIPSLGSCNIKVTRSCHCWQYTSFLGLSRYRPQFQKKSKWETTPGVVTPSCLLLTTPKPPKMARVERNGLTRFLKKYYNAIIKWINPECTQFLFKIKNEGKYWGHVEFVEQPPEGSLCIPLFWDCPPGMMMMMMPTVVVVITMATMSLCVWQTQDGTTFYLHFRNEETEAETEEGVQS